MYYTLHSDINDLGMKATAKTKATKYSPVYLDYIQRHGKCTQVVSIVVHVVCCHTLHHPDTFKDYEGVGEDDIWGKGKKLLNKYHTP